MTRRDIWRSVISFVNEKYKIKNNPSRKLNSIEDCKNKLVEMIEEIKLNSTSKELLIENQDLKDNFYEVLEERNFYEEERNIYKIMFETQQTLTHKIELLLKMSIAINVIMISGFIIDFVL